VNSGSIVQITTRGTGLISPPSAPPGETWHYQITLPFQVAPRKAAVFCNIRKGYATGIDFETGVDVILFDDLSNICADHAVPLTRNHEEPNPNTTPPGADSVIVKYPARGGFAPLGAKRADGSPHPHAGTGFAINQAISWPLHIQTEPPYAVYYYRDAERYYYHELHQLSYDGRSFQVLSTKRLFSSELVPGWEMEGGGMTNAIPDVDDLLVGMLGRKADGGGTGVMRLRREGDDWRPISFVPVPWNGRSDLSELTGKPIKLRFYFKNAKLYSFQFK